MFLYISHQAILFNYFIVFIATGRLHDELKYSERMTGRKGFQGEEEFGYEVLMQVADNENGNSLTADALFDHLEMVKKVKEMKVEHYG